MTAIAGAGNEAAINKWLTEVISKGPPSASDIAAAEAGVTLVTESGSTAVTLSDQGNAYKAASNWLSRSITAIQEKERIELSRWGHAVRTTGTDNQNTLYAKFGKASDAEKEAYVQQKLIRSDTVVALDSVQRNLPR